MSRVAAFSLRGWTKGHGHSSSSFPFFLPYFLTVFAFAFPYRSGRRSGWAAQWAKDKPFVLIRIQEVKKPNSDIDLSGH